MPLRNHRKRRHVIYRYAGSNNEHYWECVRRRNWTSHKSPETMTNAMYYPKKHNIFGAAAMLSTGVIEECILPYWKDDFVILAVKYT